MSDPLKQKTSVTSLKFAKIHCPRMKSVYWRYFGFPTNDDDRIITKQNVVCTLCNKILTNHGNTTNLRAHLQHRHKDIFNRMCVENDIKVPPRRSFKPKTTKSVAVKREPVQQQRKIKMEYKEALQDDDYSNAEESGLYETMVPMTYDDDDVIDADHFAKVEVGSATVDVKPVRNSNTNVDLMNCNSRTEAKSNSSQYVLEEMDTFQLQEAIVNLLVQDMRNVDSLNDTGMSQFVHAVCGNIIIPTEKKIESLVKELHSHKLTTLCDQIKLHSQLKHFSLGFEIWTNVEQKHFLSIYYNYITDAPDYNLLNKLYSTFEYNKYTSIDSIFEEFNLQNCTAAIVSYDCDDYLKDFLRNKNIPIVLSYDAIVDKCLRKVFALPAVASIIDEIKEVVMRYTSEINAKEVEIPILNEEFPWTYFELLKFFSEAVSWPEDLDILVATAKTIVEMLSTLAITLDTLKGEEIPHSSMLSPITTKVLNKKLAVNENDDQFVISIKSTVAEELQKSVIADDHLTISALLDPRFHRLTNITNFNSCLQILKDTFKTISATEASTTTVTKTVSSKPLTSSNARKSNLELFFDIQESSTSAALTESSNVETDLQRYRNEVHVSLDESPFLWWNKMGHLYGSLKQLANLYQCIPCIVNMRFKNPIKQQINEHQKRFMLSGNLIDAILFLHDNTKCS